ncbi:MAG: hypothetical protein EBR82_32940 [Caulobacteraceae bacterium]|nr:hypothetical protein [Caulobacteraceae bacterium]
MLEAFFNEIYGHSVDESKRLVIFTLPSQVSKKFSNVTDAANYVRSIGNSQNVYHQMALIDGNPTGRGKKQDTTSISCCWCDIDVNGENHSNEMLPKSIEEAYTFLKSLPLNPSIIVNSGGGLHGYWLFTAPVFFNPGNCEEIAEVFTKGWHGYVCKQAADRNGWKLENLGDVTRVLRTPGTWNLKKIENIKPVEFLQNDNGERYELNDFIQFIDKDAKQVPLVKPLIFSNSGQASSILAKCKAYLDKMPPSIQGQGGSTAAMLACSVIYRFGLAGSDAMEAFNHYNARSIPPWENEKEIARRFSEGLKIAEKKGAFDTSDDEAVSFVDLSNFMVQAVPVEGTEQKTKSDNDIPLFSKLPRECLSPGGIIEEIMAFNAATAIYPRVELALAGALAMVSTITGRKVEDRWALRTNAYFIGLCNSGGGKSHAKHVNNQILGALGRHDLIMPKPKSGSGIVSYLRDNNAALLQIDELSDLLETMKNPQRSPHTYEILSLLKELFSEAKNNTWKPAAYADSNKNPTIANPHLTFYGVAPSSQFWQALTKQNLTDGLVGRFLAIESVGENESNDDAETLAVPEELLEKIRAWLDFAPGGNLGSVNPRPVKLQHTEEAWKRYREHGKKTEKPRDGESEEAYALWCRTPEKTGKLAMLRACSRVYPANGRLPVIEISDVEWAIRLSNWITRNMLERAGLYVAENQNESNLLRILRICEKWTPRQTLTRRTQFLKSREREELIRDLILSERLEQRTTETSGRAGVEYRKKV